MFELICITQVSWLFHSGAAGIDLGIALQLEMLPELAFTCVKERLTRSQKLPSIFQRETWEAKAVYVMVEMHTE